jgi:GTPase SAR1 family protein
MLPYSDWQYSKIYRKSFDKANLSGSQKVKRALEYLKQSTYLWYEYIELPGKEKVLATECDTIIKDKIERLNAFFSKNKWLSPYVKSVDIFWNTTKFILHRPLWSDSINTTSIDENWLIQALWYEPSKYRVIMENRSDYVIKLVDTSKPSWFLKFNELRKEAKANEYLLGKDVFDGSLTKLGIVWGSNMTLMILWISWSGKTNLLISLFINLYEQNATKYKFLISTTKPDLYFTAWLNWVLKYADNVRWHFEIQNFILHEIERRKMLFKGVGVGNISDYNNLQNEEKKLPLIFSMQDELSDTMTQIEAELWKDWLKEFQMKIRSISITARSYGIIQVIALQSGLMSIFSNNRWSEFRDTFTTIAFNLKRADATRWVFWDNKSNAHLLEPWQAVYMDKDKKAYRTFQIAYIEQSDKEEFLERNKDKLVISNRDTFIDMAQKNWKISLKIAKEYGISDREYRELTAKLEADGMIIKLPWNQFIFTNQNTSKVVQKW